MEGRIFCRQSRLAILKSAETIRSEQIVLSRHIQMEIVIH